MRLHRALRAALFLPYAAVCYPLLALRRAGAALRPNGGGEWRTWITPTLLLGGFLAPGDVDELASLGVGAVVNVSHELFDPRDALAAVGIANARVPCWDTRAPTLEDAERGVAFIAAQVAAGRKVYVHCASGVGRSVALALCSLATREGADVDDALARIRRVRHRVAMRPVQRAFVDRYVRWHRARSVG